MNQDIINNCKDNMELSLSNLDKKFGTVRAGRANPSSLDGVVVEYYGSMMPIKQLATISVPEARQLLIKPFDRGCLSAIEKAIFESNLGYTPNNDGETIRIVIPQLTEERRLELIKQVKALGEECRIAIRNIRHDYMEKIEKEDYPEDIAKSLQEKIQNLVNEYNKKVDDKLKAKEEELITV